MSLKSSQIINISVLFGVHAQLSLETPADPDVASFNTTTNTLTYNKYDAAVTTIRIHIGAFNGKNYYLPIHLYEPNDAITINDHNATMRYGDGPIHLSAKSSVSAAVTISPAAALPDGLSFDSNYLSYTKPLAAPAVISFIAMDAYHLGGTNQVVFNIVVFPKEKTVIQ
jgi:hypothetical protein